MNIFSTLVDHMATILCGECFEKWNAIRLTEKRKNKMSVLCWRLQLKTRRILHANAPTTRKQKSVDFAFLRTSQIQSKCNQTEIKYILK